MMRVASGQQVSPTLPPPPPPPPRPRPEEVTGGEKRVGRCVGEEEAAAVEAVATVTAEAAAVVAMDRRKLLTNEEDSIVGRRGGSRAGDGNADGARVSLPLVGAPSRLTPPTAAGTRHSFSVSAVTAAAAPVTEVRRRASGGSVVVGRGGTFRGKNISGSSSSSSSIGAAAAAASAVAGGSPLVVAERSEGAAEQRDEAAARGRRILETEGAVENMRRRLSAMGFLEADGQSGGGSGGSGGGSGGSGGGVEQCDSGQATAGLTAPLAVGQGRSENVAVGERGGDATRALGETAARPHSAASPIKEAFSSAEAYRRARRSVTEMTMSMRLRSGGGVREVKGGVESSGDKPPLIGSADPMAAERGGAADRNAYREAAATVADCSGVASPPLAGAGQGKRRGSVPSNNNDGPEAGTGDKTRRVTLDTVTPSPSPPSAREGDSWRPSADRESWAPPRSSSSSLSSFSSRRGGGGDERAEAKHSPGASRPSVEGKGAAGQTARMTSHWPSKQAV